MKKEYLSEAFRQLELLNEEDFNLSTTADNSDLKDFLDNDDMSVMSLDVIDPEAETEEDLEDSYTGKVILDCCVCHSKLYKDKEEVQIDEEQDLANVGEECPFCYSNDGFKIIGEVAPYGETEEGTEIGDEEHEDDVPEGFDESLNQIRDKSVNESNRKSGFENMSMKDLYFYYKDNIDPDEYPTFIHWAKTIITPTYSENDEIEESLDESIQEIEIETDTDKIKIESEPKEEFGETEDILVPVSPETEQQIENNSSDEIDVPIDEFDEETFDELGESFLKNTYDNVVSYKTESIKEQDGNKLVVEGLIKFNSGNTKKTTFIFEAKDITKTGRVRFIGENCQLSRGKKSFTVAGKVNEGKFISESLNYNYRAKDVNGKSARMYGTVRTNK